MADNIVFQFSGGDQFLVDVRRWRDRLRTEVHRAALGSATALAAATRMRYPRRTGALKRNVTQTDDAPVGDTVLTRVRSLAPHSHLYEYGTKSRATVRGWRRGRMPAHSTLIPEAIRIRRDFNAQVRIILASPEPALGAGAPTVTGRL